MWTYSQSSGKLTSATGAVTGTGYSGRGPGLNNPEMQNVKDVGPLPQGHYTFGDLVAHDPVVGEYAIPLIPSPDNQMFGRGDFFCHGDNPQVNHSASEGCIIMALTVREEIWLSDDHELIVTA